MTKEKRTASQVGRGSKQKGNSFENQISKKIREYFIPDVNKKTAYNIVHRTGMSGGRTERGDLIVQPPLLEYFPWFVEARNRESWSWENILKKGVDSVILKWFLEDAVDKCHPFAGDPKNERFPLLIFTKNQDQWYACFFEDHAPIFAPTDYSVNKFSIALPSKDSKRRLMLITSFDSLLHSHEKPHQELFDNLTFK